MHIAQTRSPKVTNVSGIDGHSLEQVTIQPEVNFLYNRVGSDTPHNLRRAQTT